MPSYPYVLLSAAVSLDGYLDDTSPERLLLSSPADFDRVDEVRASVDAILIGAGTIRADNPRLLVNSAERRAARMAAGKPEYPLKVTVSASGELDPTANFWHTGGEKIVYTTEKGAERLRRAPVAADVVALGADLDWRRLLRHLREVRGVERLMVEGAAPFTRSSFSRGWRTRCSWCWRPCSWAIRTRPGCSDPAATRAVGCGWSRRGRSRTSC